MVIIMAIANLSEEVGKIIYEQLPQIIRNQPEVRFVIWDMLSEKFASKDKTEDRFEKILERMREYDKKFDKQIERMREYDKKFDDMMEEIKALEEKSDRKFEQVFKKLEENDRKFEQVFKKLEENDRKFEQVFKKLEENDRKFEQVFKKLEENDRKFEEQNRRFDKKFEEQNRRFDKKFEEQNRKFDKKFEEQNRKFDEKFEKMLNEIRNVDKRIDRTIGALGARWGLSSEHAFREAIKGVLEEYTDTRVERYLGFDNKGEVFGWPDQVEIDVVVKNGKLCLMEIKSSVSKNDVYVFGKKAAFYEKETGRKPDKKIIVSPMFGPGAQEFARKLKIETYTAPEDIP